MSETPAIVRRASGMAAILQLAASNGLPMPCDATADEIRASLWFRTLSDLTDWALWMDAAIGDTGIEDGKRVHHQAIGRVLDQHVAVWCITPSITERALG